ncbi:hypothetical protein [Capnocytophaga canimorsus]|uniref:hypothetical protein n=1 Tax=Capnocytophaga canimorsus TaxID=28188 RepID=UPI0005897C29|nr:hypothetical protein [Capnocytophaga canimorsus]ATA76259.1 hypothetical protein CGC47_00920 [Capnocytophaga canimorsus]PJI77178.1 hypothetical protein CLV61_1667 [Capnocytophaga canimorsus]CEN44414.1 conserved exported hypothetical protein [Capnocytophaga canimorsus]STA71386.1 Uncharacterised protein [Capnocytophaga canimorsus]VEJ18252.1 Uncharacterised protein [Capnocytophaga canimorsus]
MNKILFGLLTGLCLTACKKTDTKFEITNDKVGLLHKNTKIEQLDSIFVKDSIASSAFEGELRYASNERIILFEKGGKQLLEITPGINSENTKVVESVLVLDNRYTTDKGISLQSTYKDIKNNHPEFNIQQTLNSVLIILPNENYFFTFDKSALKTSKFGISSQIGKEDISDEAKPSRITINWDL